MKRKEINKHHLSLAVSHIKKPQDLSLEKWQILLRQQMAREHKFKIKNQGTQPVFSDFSVCNPATNKTYRVSIGGENLGDNYCSCPDFAVNTLGTCKHIESVLHKLRRRKEPREALREGPQFEHSALTLRYGLQRRVAFCFGIKASHRLKNLVARFFNKDLLLIETGLQNFDKFVAEAKTLSDDVRYHQDAVEFIASLRDGQRRRMRLERMFPEGITGKPWDSLLHTQLYPYQREGVLFAASAGRSLIADDMGLGKTIQAIATAVVMARCFGIKKVMIICPSSLKFQWKREIERFTKRNAKIIQGTLLKRQRQYLEDEFFKIVNYDVIHRDLAVITKWSPELIILDEAQRIKNWKTRMARCVKQLKSPYTIVLTGTPLENRLEEIHSIVAFVDRHHFGPLFRFLHRHQHIDDSGKVIGYKDLHRLGESLQSIMIRRRRHEVLKELPQRSNKNYFVPLTKEQWEIHDENREIVARLVSKWRRYHFLSEEDQKRLMRCLQTMRMVCDNTYLIDQTMRHGQKVPELEIQLKEIFEDPKVKVVIFSQWLRMMELIILRFKANGWGHVFLNGNVPSSQRGDLIKTFHDDPSCRIFLSTETGSMGLNLQNASVVINVDMPWNPAVLEQRISRVHRLGQTSPVRIINFIAENGIEHGMLGLLKFKQSMFSGVLDGGDNDIFMEESRFSRFIKTVEEATHSLPTAEEMNNPSLESEAAQDKASADEEIESSEEIDASGQPPDQTIPVPPVPTTQTTDLIKTFLKSGAAFLNQLSESLNTANARPLDSNDQPKLSRGIQLHQDQTTGQRALHIPLPDEDALKQIGFFLEGFLNK